MTTRTLFAALFVALVGAFVPAGALAADPADTVKADLAQLTSHVTAAHDQLVADLAAVTSAAASGDKAGTVAALKQFRTDRLADSTEIRAERTQLRTDLQAAHDAKVTGLRPLVRTAVAQDRAALREIRQTARQARHAVHALRKTATP